MCLCRFCCGFLCRCGEESRGCGMGFKKCMHLLLYLSYSQESKGILQTSSRQGESLRIPNQLFVASWFRGKRVLSLRIFPPLSRFGDAEGQGCIRGRNYLCGYRVCLIERCRAPQDGHTALHLAATKGHAAVVEQLLAAGAVKAAKCKVRRTGVEGCR